MKRSKSIRPEAKIAIVQQSRNRWKSDAGDFALALDAASFTLLHGDRKQQIEAANAARGLMAAKGYPVRKSEMLHFTVKARVAGMDGVHIWDAIGHNAIDVTLDALEKYEGQFVSISVRPEA
ncbi:hypothetical protein L1889_03675 [Paenalcaligenes niemegkensis]|uniref:hypothetical protein n=1 Tax=Paenalcaligenes niemegkensis TaxID=2895469 RepID=UPI001EE8BA81|nr:hypothetical protein [Paenalcaligenes niemegkensis]MCQ9615909.1 hypothetical protein [Paenalcaligenes niemegkensis]